MKSNNERLKEIGFGLLVVALVVIGGMLGIHYGSKSSVPVEPPAVISETTEIDLDDYHLVFGGMLTFSADAEGTRLNTDYGEYIIQDGLIVEYLPEEE